MAITASGLYAPTFRDTLGNSQIGLNLDLETHKIALFNNTITPNYNTDTAYGVAPYNANEVTGTNWSAGGVTITTTTFTVSGVGLMFDAADVSVATTTLSNARGGLIYADALTGNNAICLVNFGADYSTTAGTFAITWNVLGIFTLDLTP